MRAFPIYAPKMIVKHARLHLDGEIAIGDVGQLVFKEGRFVMRSCTTPEIKKRILELNRLIDAQIAASKLDA